MTRKQMILFDYVVYGWSLAIIIASWTWIVWEIIR